MEYAPGHKIYEDTHTMWFPRVSPDGQFVAISQQQGAEEWITIVDRHGNVRSRSKRRQVMGQEGAAWTPDGREVWFAGAEAAMASAIHAITPDGLERVVHRSAGSLRIQDIVRDGRALVIRDVNSREITVVDISTRAERDLTWLGQSLPNALTPGGREVLFGESGAGKDGDWGGFIRGTDGSPAVRIADGNPVAMSPDERLVLVVSLRPPHLSLVSRGDGDVRALDPGTARTFTAQGTWTPDGQRVVFLGREQGRPPRVFVQAVDGGAPHR